MKLHKRTFRSVPNPMFVQKSQEAVEGGSSNLIINDLPLTQEEVSTLLQNRAVVLETTDSRIELFNTSDILTVTLFGDNYSAFVMKNPNSATDRFLTFQVFTSIFVLALLEDSGIYYLNFFTDELADSEQINSILGQIDILTGDINNCVKYTDIDEELSETSTNPVQNKVIYEALESKKLYLHTISLAHNYEKVIIINNDSTPLINNELVKWLYNNEFRSYNSVPASDKSYIFMFKGKSVTFDGTSIEHPMAIYSGGLTGNNISLVSETIGYDSTTNKFTSTINTTTTNSIADIVVEI